MEDTRLSWTEEFLRWFSLAQLTFWLTCINTTMYRFMTRSAFCPWLSGPFLVDTAVRYASTLQTCNESKDRQGSSIFLVGASTYAVTPFNTQKPMMQWVLTSTLLQWYGSQFSV